MNGGGGDWEVEFAEHPFIVQCVQNILCAAEIWSFFDVFGVNFSAKKSIFQNFFFRKGFLLT